MDDAPLSPNPSPAPRFSMGLLAWIGLAAGILGFLVVTTWRQRRMNEYIYADRSTRIALRAVTDDVSDYLYAMKAAPHSINELREFILKEKRGGFDSYEHDRFCCGYGTDGWGRTLHLESRRCCDRIFIKATSTGQNGLLGDEDDRSVWLPSNPDETCADSCTDETDGEQEA
jgi:hypothetical protein